MSVWYANRVIPGHKQYISVCHKETSASALILNFTFEVFAVAE